MMMRGTLAMRLAEHVAAGPEEAAAREQMVELLVAAGQPLRRDAFTPGHVTASGFVLSPDGEQLLLVFHRKLQRWLQPGGHIDPSDASVEAAARREVEEETGARALMRVADVPWALDVDVHTIPARPDGREPSHLHFDVRFLFRAGSWDVVAASDVEAVRWVALDEVHAVDTDASVLRAVAKIQRIVRAHRQGRQADAPATHRNRGPLLDALSEWVRPGDTVLEIASGTGQHAAYLAAALPVSAWIPSDPSADARASIRAWCHGVAAVQEPLELDVTRWDWWTALGAPVDVVLAVNMVHIAPFAATLGLLRGAAEALPIGGRLVLYGPYHVAGAATAPSNVAFDASLRARDPAWGVRHLENVVSHAAQEGLTWCRTIPMPANNLVVVFERQGRSDDPEIEDVLRYWFGDGPEPDAERRRAWWSHDPDADAFIAERFGALHAAAAAGKLADWATTPRGALALIIVLDQFSRQLHRGTAGMFACDAQALDVSMRGGLQGWPKSLALHEQLYWWMPWMHAEDRAVQAGSVAVFQELAANAASLGDERYAGNAVFADKHRVIVERFGRYPHRNALLGRQSTPEELEFLTQPGSSF